MSPDATILLESKQENLQYSSTSKTATFKAFHYPTKMNADTIIAFDTNETIISPNTSDIALYKAALIENDAGNIFFQATKKCRTMMCEKKDGEGNAAPATPNCLPPTTNNNEETNAIISDTSDSSITESDDGYQSSVSSLAGNQDILDDDDWDFQATKNAPIVKPTADKNDRRSKKRPICSDVSENYGVRISNAVPPMTPNLPPMRLNFKTGYVGPIRPRPLLPGRDYFLAPSGKRRVVVKSNIVNEWPFSTMMQSSGNISLIHFDHRPKKDGANADKKESNKAAKRQCASSDVLDAAMTLSSWLPHDTAHPNQAEGVTSMPLRSQRLACHSGDN